MARVGRRGGPGWVWPLLILLLLIGLGLLAWAFLAQPEPAAQPTEEPTPAAAPAPTEEEAVSIRDITTDPSQFYGKDAIVEGRITRMVGDMGVFLADEDGSALLAVLDRKVADTDLRQDDMGRFSGTVREVTGEELDRLADDVDKPTRDAIAQQKAYLSVEDFEEIEGE